VKTVKSKIREVKIVNWRKGGKQIREEKMRWWMKEGGKKEIRVSKTHL
jgi:hypothetical protein